MPAVCVDDGAGDRQNHAHPMRLGGEEGVEDPRERVGGCPRTTAATTREEQGEQEKQQVSPHSPAVYATPPRQVKDGGADPVVPTVVHHIYEP
jgi:hypothetical protein